MTFISVMGAIILLGLAITATFFRRGGIYNPIPESEPLPPNQPNMPSIPQTTPSEPISAPSATLDVLCDAIAEMEGANPANNNRGNCRFYEGGYATMYGKVKRSSGGFAMFATPALGDLYLHNLLIGKIHRHPDWSLYELFQNYAPEEDGNDPVHYSKFVAKKMGVDNSYKIGGIRVV